MFRLVARLTGLFFGMSALSEPQIACFSGFSDSVLPFHVRVANGSSLQLRPKAVEQWPDYEKYQAKTERDIPLVICE